MSIEDEVIEKVSALVVNQARYQLPNYLIPENDPDGWYNKAETMTDAETYKYLEGKDILDRDNLLELVRGMGLATLYSEDNVDSVSEYIIDHQQDCHDLYQFLLEK